MGLKIIKIDKNEKDFLESKNIPFGENGISHTVARGKKITYYLCESVRNKQLHKEYQKMITK